MKKLLSVFLCSVLFIQIASIAFATNHEATPDSSVETLSANEIDALYEEYCTMSPEELNAIISNAKQQMENTNQPSPRFGIIQDAWLAAAAIVEPDYPCSAKLVEFSVKGYNYKEHESAGLFGRKILNDDAYKNWRSQYSLSSPESSVTFTATADLYYSLHIADIALSSISSYGADIEITDTFDFDVKFMGSIFATVVNDWAWLCQQTGILHKIDVDIVFTDANWDGYTR